MHRSAPAKTWRIAGRAASLVMMPRDRALFSICAGALALLAGAAPAGAGVPGRRSHVVVSGESLWKIARAHQCEVDELRRANRLDGNVIRAGQRLRIPLCRARIASAASGETARRDRDGGDEDRARDDRESWHGGSDERTSEHRASEDRAREDRAHEDRVIATVLPARTRIETTVGLDMVPVAVPLIGQSFGRPQDGYLVSGSHIPANPAAYYLRRPERAWGTDHTVAQIVRAIRLVRRRFPRVHPLAIGDLSARHGGPLSLHGSHQSGRDADIGFYYRQPQRGYPKSFVVATADNLDFPATWALISALCRTADSALGVERIYMTYSTQALFYRLARKHRVPATQLEEWFQYPHGRRADHGIIRHEPGHDEHIHVRFHCAPADVECR
jgi:murein endopeptidase